MKVAKVICVVLFALVQAVPAFAQLVEYYHPSRMLGRKRTSPPARFDHANRNLEEARQLYRDVYVPASEVPYTWNPGSDCDPGSIPQEVMQARLSEINYFRKMAGLCPLRTDSSFNRAAQAAASMMHKKGEITNYATPEWPCYSQEAADGASHSMVGWGTNVMSFMQDCAGGSASGFRSMLLYEQLEVIGYGATDKTEVIYARGLVNDFHDSLPEFVAWPPAGFVPAEVATTKWTFKIPYSGTNYSYATAHVYLDGKELPTAYCKPWGNDYSGLIWEVKDWYLWQDKAIDHKIVVKINHAKVNGKMQFYEYEVRFFRGIEQHDDEEVRAN